MEVPPEWVRSPDRRGKSSVEWVTAKIYGGEAAATNLMVASFPHYDQSAPPTIPVEMIATDATSVFSLSLSLFHSLSYVSIYSSHILKSTKRSCSDRSLRP